MIKTRLKRAAALITAFMLLISCVTILQTTSGIVKASDVLIDTFRIDLISGAEKGAQCV